MKKYILLFVIVIAVFVGSSSAEASIGKKCPNGNGHKAKGAYKIAKKAWNVSALNKSGKHIKQIRHKKICNYSKNSKVHVSKVINKQRKRYKKAKLAAKQPQYGALNPPGEAWLAGVRACESGGNYSTNTGNGFYGAYQFDLGTWGSVGGSGLPSNASSGEQDYRASLLYQQRGGSPWPVCG